jgi:hypothetical protein
MDVSPEWSLLENKLSEIFKIIGVAVRHDIRRRSPFVFRDDGSLGSHFADVLCDR